MKLVFQVLFQRNSSAMQVHNYMLTRPSIDQTYSSLSINKCFGNYMIIYFSCFKALKGKTMQTK